MKLKISSLDELNILASSLANYLQAPAVVYLHGDLGAGKTTFVQNYIQGLNYQGVVKSPTFTLVEGYELNGIDIYHFDLYRIEDDHELEDIGIREYFDGKSICFIEWPEKGLGALPDFDLKIQITLNHATNDREFYFDTPSEEISKILSKIYNELSYSG